MALVFSISKRCLSTSGAKNAIKNVAVIGGGLMGSGIAQVAAQTGHQVTLVDINDEVLKKAMDSITKDMVRVAKKVYKNNPDVGETFVKDSKNRLKTTTDMGVAVKDADLVVEAVIEDMDVKHKVFRALDELAPEKTIFASNTSSFVVGEIATATKRRDRFGGLHFFNPVPVMQLLEVVRTPELSEDAYHALIAWGKAIGKVCVTCKDTPGFIVNRLLIPYVMEAGRMYERGDASAKDIDTAMKLGAGYPMGPLELSDYTGHDTGLLIIEGWHKRFPDNPMFKPPEILKKLVKEGKLGRKSGEGFYKYTK